MKRALLLTTLSAALACAQLSTGSIVGTVKDPSGLAMAAVSITATHAATGGVRQTTSNERGDFVLNSLEPGVYTLSFVMSGFKKKELDNVTLTTGETLPAGDIKLELGGVSETVSVTSQGAVVMTRSSDRADLISSGQIENLVVRGRSFTDLTQLLPGVVSTSKSTDISTNPSIYVMGNRQTSNNVTIDGVVANDMGNGYQMKIQVSQDAVAEVKVETSNYQAEYGRTHTVSINYFYDLPKSPWKNAVAGRVFNDWQISGITTFQSGAPLGISVATTTNIDITGTPSITPRAYLTGNPNLSRGSRTFSQNFNTSVVQLPAVGTFGNAARNVIRGPGINNWDLALVKNVPIRERLRLQLRWEAYNAFNHTQFSTINTSANFNPATGQQINAQFGAFTAARDPRQMQMAVRLSF